MLFINRIRPDRKVPLRALAQMLVGALLLLFAASAAAAAEPAKSDSLVRVRTPKDVKKPAAQRPAEEDTARSAPTPKPQPLVAKPALPDLDDEFDADADVDQPTISDPLFGWNVCWFWFNDSMYRFMLKPGAVGWKYLFYPRFIRRGFQNLFDNLCFPRRFFNCLFQGRMKDSGVEFTRFLTNTTIGVAGLWDPSSVWFGLKERDADFDQTLGVWGSGTGIFLTWPILGPSSVRGTPAQILDLALNGTTAIPGGGVVSRMNDISLGDDPYDSIRRMAVKPYPAVRDAYVDYRAKKVAEVRKPAKPRE